MGRIPLGRERELAAAADLIARPDGGCAALVLVGEPGIGKTTLLDAAIGDAIRSGYRVLSCRPAESEASLPFVSLSDLLEPAMEAAFANLPPVQRAALDAALMRVEPTGELGRHAVSRATLAVVRELAREAPVLVAIDDVQWLDRSTAEILGFVLRRLGDAPVRILLSVRSGQEDDAIALARSVPGVRLAVGPLSVEQLGRLIVDRVGVPLTRPRVLELHATTGGNPYYALEVVRALAGGDEPLGATDPLPVPDDIASLLRGRIGGLSAAARDALLLAAASAQPSTLLLARIAGLGGGLEEAVAAGIVEVEDGRVRFTHPMLASVVYGGAPPAARHDAHSQLASVVEDPEERAVHLARATSVPDAEVSAELHAAAGRAYRRGAPPAAAELEEQARRLTPMQCGEERFARTLKSAEYHLAAGDTEHGRRLLEDLLEAGSGGPEHARIALLLGKVRYVSDDVAAAHALFGDALAAAGDDEALCAEAEQALAFTAMLAGDVPGALGHARSSLALAERLGEPRILALASCRLALNLFLAGQGVDRRLFERAVELEGEYLEDVPVEWLPSYAYAWVWLMSDDLENARSLYEQLARAAEEHLDERFVASVLFATSELETRAGNWARASRLAAEAVERSRQSGLGTIHAWALHTQALVAAHLGRISEARDAAAEGLRVASASRAIAPVAQITSTLGFLELSLGDPKAAHGHLGPLAELIASIGIAEPGVVRFMPDAIEALIGQGELQDAARLLDVLDERAQGLDRISARAAAARCRALLDAARGDVERARAWLQEAFAQHSRLQEPFELARTLLAQGSIERRARQRAAARSALTRALELFDNLGAALWSERTVAELARIPGRAASPDELSEAERRVAELACQGLANKEIAARLYVTVRTVEAHLSKVYAKLGVRSRAELAARVGNRDRTPSRS
jgi:DNA-binding CsgD family transcriptional regulator